MSYILDALRRSEQERRPGSALGFARRDPGPATLPPRRLIWLAAPVIGVLALLAGAYLLFLRPVDKPPETIARASIDAEPVTTPSAPATTPAPKPQDTPAPTVKVAPPAPQKPAPPPVRDLVEQTRITPKPAPRPLAYAPNPLAVAAPVSAFPARSGDDVRLLRVMPPDFQRALPEMVVNIHVYAAAEAERILYINNRQYHAGDKVRDDVVVEEIVEDGAVLNFRGQRFKLPRPS